VSEPRSDQEWIDFYADQSGIYDAFTESLESLIETLLEEEEIEYAWIHPFTSAPIVLAGQIGRARRAGRVYDNPLESPLRVSGVSIRLANLVPVAEIDELIRREFAVDPAGSLSAEEAAALTERLADPLAADSLSYDFLHYLISLDERRLELPEWSRFAGLKVRLEVKTHLQNAWDEIDVGSPFFLAETYPAEVRELLARSIRTLSAVDADLTRARHTVWRLFSEYEEAIAAGDLQLPVNGVALLAYMQTSELVQSLREVGQDVGLTSEPEYQPGWETIESGIFWLLRRADVHTIAELEEFLKQATPRARETLAELARLATDRGFTPPALPESIVEWLWLVLRRADAETVSQLYYVEELQYALNTLIGNPVHADEPETT